MTAADILAKALRRLPVTVEATDLGARIRPDNGAGLPHLVATLQAFGWAHDLQGDGSVTVPATALA